MPRWSIPILWYPDSAITSLYQPVLTPVPLGDSASKAWSLLDNAYPLQDSALANARASLSLGTDIRASLHLLTRNANPTGLIHSSCTSFLQILSYRFILLWFVLFLNHFSSLWGMEKWVYCPANVMTLRTPPSHRTVVKSWFREVLILLRKQLQTNIANRRQYRQQSNCVYL